jgi:hypothetical protein
VKPAQVNAAHAEQAIAALQAAGAAQRDPVGVAWVQALARRSTQQTGPLRQVLEERLASAVAACSARMAAAEPVQIRASRVPDASAKPARTALGELLDRLAAHAGDATATEPRALRQAREAWVRLDVEHQVAQSLRKAAAQAGPLNSHHLLLRVLQKLQQTSPAYLGAFVAQVEALLWLERAGLGQPLSRPGPRDKK